MNTNNKNVLIYGAVGLILPIIASPLVTKILMLYKPYKTDNRGMLTGQYSFTEFYSELISPGQLPIFMSLCALANLPVFFFFLWKKKDVKAKGILFGTLVYAAIYMIIKLG